MIDIRALEWREAEVIQAGRAETTNKWGVLGRWQFVACQVHDRYRTSKNSIKCWMCWKSTAMAVN